MRGLLLTAITILSTWTYIPLSNLSSEVINDQNSIQGSEAYKDRFAVLICEEGCEDQAPDFDFVLGETIDSDLIYRKLLVEIPLVRCDYYYGKHINAAAAINEINQVPVLEPGDRVSLIRNGYLTMSRSRGYVSPGSGFLYASGVCWSTSALGSIMDEANKLFNHKYQMPLFVFRRGDRSPHPVSYQTYRNSNFGRGYSIVKIPNGYSTDFSFTVNPELKNNPRFSNLKVKIVMISSTSNEQAFLGQSIGGYIRTNVNF